MTPLQLPNPPPSLHRCPLYPTTVLSSTRAMQFSSARPPSPHPPPSCIPSNLNHQHHHPSPPSPPFVPTGTSTPPSAVPPIGIPATFACARAWTLRSHALPQSPHARPSPCYPTPRPHSLLLTLPPSPQLDWHHANLRPAAAGTFQQAFLWPLLGLPVSDVLKEQNSKNLHLCLKDLDAALTGAFMCPRARARA